MPCEVTISLPDEEDVSVSVMEPRLGEVVVHAIALEGRPGEPGPPGPPGIPADGAIDPGDLTLIFDNKLL